MPGCSFGGRPCGVGAGFLEDYLALAPEIKGNLEAIGCDRASPLLVTGHSLGGALAAVAMMDLALDNYTVARGYTFGQPRVGDPTFAAAFRQALGDVPIFRVTQSGDPVPLLPKAGRFEHVGQELYFESGSSSYRVCKVPEAGEDPACAIGQTGRLFWLLLRAAFNLEMHMGYLPPQRPFRTKCDAQPATFYP